ncbi:MAG: MFS transporter [Fimbriimonadaceae bacterium]|nr:MFS transporter [Fimbriimonadaceae bacterium]
MQSTGTAKKSNVILAIVAASLGYFVDVYDIWLYSVLRVDSLNALGFTDKASNEAMGHLLLNTQMAGFILGAIAFGIISDKKGRLAVLFGSIFLYSIANIANGFVANIPMYAVCRFVAGVGLAGELGAGIALVSELVPKEFRGWATTLVATCGVAGSVAAAMFAKVFPWNIGYWIGGGMGIALLIFRIGVFESGMFERLKENDNIRRGDFLGLFKTKERATRYLATILNGAPVWFFAGLFMTFSKELQEALNIANPFPVADIIMISAIGLTVGDVIFGGLSQILKSRRKAFTAALTLMAIAIALILTVTKDRTSFYWLMFVAGVGAGYWAVFVTTAGETFGTNLRGTVAVTAPSFVRGLVIPLSIIRGLLIPQFGPIGALTILGVVVLSLAVWAVYRLPETYGRDLEFVESHENVGSDDLAPSAT